MLRRPEKVKRAAGRLAEWWAMSREAVQAADVTSQWGSNEVFLSMG